MVGWQKLSRFNRQKLSRFNRATEVVWKLNRLRLHIHVHNRYESLSDLWLFFFFLTHNILGEGYTSCTLSCREGWASLQALTQACVCVQNPPQIKVDTDCFWESGVSLTPGWSALWCEQCIDDAWRQGASILMPDECSNLLPELGVWKLISLSGNHFFLLLFLYHNRIQSS